MKSLTIVIILVTFFTSCNNDPRENKNSVIAINANSDIEIPFHGKRGFDTRPGYSGTGTPHRFVEVMANGDVFFSFEQENQADKTITEEKYYAGKLKRYMKCHFKKLEEEILYEFTRDTIYEVDENRKRLKSNDCCEGFSDDKTECGCISTFFSIAEAE